MPHTWSWSAGVSQELFGQVALSVDYVANASRNQLGVIDINEPVNGVRPGVAAFDPTGALIPAEARGVNFQRVLQSQTSDAFDGDYKSLQVSLVQAHGQPLERPPRLHAAAQQLRRHRQPRRPPGVARQRHPRRLRRVLVQPHQRARRQRQLEPVAAR